MKVIRKDPGQQPKLVEIPNTLEALREAVGGCIETMKFCTDACVVCDEEGLFKGKEYNCNFLGVNFVGTILLVGIAGEELCDVPGGEFTLSLMKKCGLNGKATTEKDGDYRHAADCVSSAGNGRNVPLQERGPGGGQAGAGEADQHERLERGGHA